MFDLVPNIKKLDFRLLRLWIVFAVLVIGATGHPALSDTLPEDARYLVAFDTSKKVEERVISRQSALGIASSGQTNSVTFSLPANTRISALSAHNGSLYAVPESSFEVGEQVFTPRTVFHQKDNDTLQPIFDGTQEGIPGNVKITGLSVDGSNIYLTLNIFAVINGLHVSPNDIILWDGEKFSPYFSAKEAGIPATARISDFHIFTDDAIEFSFDSSIQISDTDYRRDSILRFTPTTTTWSASSLSDTFSALCTSCKFEAMTFDARSYSIFADRFETSQ